MPCWRHEAELATLSNTWFLCDDCRELERDIAIAVAADAAEQLTGRPFDGELTDSRNKAGSEGRPDLVHTSQSPPPGARPERDPAYVLTVASTSQEAPSVLYVPAPLEGEAWEVYDYAVNENLGNQS